MVGPRAGHFPGAHGGVCIGKCFQEEVILMLREWKEEGGFKKGGESRLETCLCKGPVAGGGGTVSMRD